MSTPIIESIAENITTSIAEITVANGFYMDLTAVRTNLVTFSEITVDNGKVLVWQGNSQSVGEPAAMCQEWETDFFIEAVAVDKGEADSIDTLLNLIAADIEKKLKEDNKRGGYALDCKFPSVAKMYDEEFASVAVEMTVHWRHQENDPYTQI